ncbi:hypothetical protein EJB05_06433 [Eragrostis curvula]|uniref:Uncharacterized protein n=1 Tax=Eragrostis curvula TaxID=38414 RepID=A0A5J9WFN7_9POAL|nr:hypothetical protein EJB05_06433 [Eragrostis curvula]
MYLSVKRFSESAGRVGEPSSLALSCQCQRQLAEVRVTAAMAGDKGKCKAPDPPPKRKKQKTGDAEWDAALRVAEVDLPSDRGPRLRIGSSVSEGQGQQQQPRRSGRQRIPVVPLGTEPQSSQHTPISRKRGSSRTATQRTRAAPQQQQQQEESSSSADEEEPRVTEANR